MLFNSLTFLVFFVVVFALRWVLPAGWSIKKGILLVASIVFYGFWRPEYLLLLLFSTIVDWFAAQRIAAAEPARRKRWLMVSLCSNLGLLAFFKYTNFAINNINAASDLILGSQAITPLNILLPVGISFYTFQTLSYTLDVYRGTMKPWRSFWDFALFVTFFPQLVAGPIVRAVDFEEQCERERGLEVGRVCWGLVLVLWGITQKVVFSDGYLARVVDEVYGGTQAPGLVDAWVGTLAFSGQIYFDFAGYSLCAIGLAIALGFDLPKNFHAPYASTGFSDFWRRWHISLSTWLRDYLYISLGGNRGSAQRTYFNLFMTMVLGGLWHGASWNFLLWGALHGAFLIAERLLRPWIDGWRWARGALGAAAGMALTYVLVCVAWVPFRAKDLTATLGVWAGMVGANPATALSDGTSQLYAMLVVLLMLVGHNVMRRCELDEVAGAVGWPGLALGVMGCIWLLLTHVGIGGHEFIYFQF